MFAAHVIDKSGAEFYVYSPIFVDGRCGSGLVGSFGQRNRSGSVEQTKDEGLFRWKDMASFELIEEPEQLEMVVERAA